MDEHVSQSTSIRSTHVKPPHCPYCATEPTGELVVAGGAGAEVVGFVGWAGGVVTVGAGALLPSQEKTAGPGAQPRLACVNTDNYKLTRGNAPGIV